MKRKANPILVILLLTGAALRLIPYFLHFSLFIDEASVALNITDKSFAGLLHPLDYQQVAPVLFLFIEKINIILFGNSEYSLRLFPLLCGLLSMPLVYSLTKSISGNINAALVALFLFASSPVLIDFTNQVKQYESDVFCTLFLLNLVFNSRLSSNRNKQFILLAIVGSVFIFLSNITALVLFTIGVYYLYKYRLVIFRMPLLLTAFVCWLISFFIYYVLFIYHQPLRNFMLNYWQNDFMPFNIVSSQFYVWMYNMVLSLFKFYSLPFLAVFLLSIVVFIVKKQWLFLFLLLFPIAVHCIVSGFKLYPFDTRLILYLTAFITPALAIGIAELVPLFKKRITVYGVAALLMLLVYSLVAQLVNTHYPFSKEEITKSIDYINSNRSAGQKVYVYSGANRAVNYYVRINRVPFKDDLVWGTTNRTKPQNYINEIKEINGEVWLLFSHNDPEEICPVYPTKGKPAYYGEEDFIVSRLIESHAVLLKWFKTTGSTAYLFKLNK